MKTIYDRPLTLDELVEEARKRHERLCRHNARHLCSAGRVDPDQHQIGPYLHGECCGDNLNATIRWLKAYLQEDDICLEGLDLAACIDAFQAELHIKIPPHFWGEE